MVWGGVGWAVRFGGKGLEGKGREGKGRFCLDGVGLGGM